MAGHEFPLALDGIGGGTSIPMDPPPIEFSVIIPARDEEGNIHPLLDELSVLLAGGSLNWEVLVVDDGSSDGTLRALLDVGVRLDRLKILCLKTPQGKSAALAAGISVARGDFLGMMDADMQNCPKDFLPMIHMLKADPKLTLVQGHRVRRHDSWARRKVADIGFFARKILLGDQVQDTGCGLRVMRRDAARQLPLQFEGLHRFIPILIELGGGRVCEIPVDHRPRHAGRSKYHIGFLSRGGCGLLDLLAVRWMIWRKRSPSEAIVLNREKTP